MEPFQFLLVKFLLTFRKQTSPAQPKKFLLPNDVLRLDSDRLLLSWIPVYPNPFVSEIYIGENNRSVEIYNLNGGLVYGMSQPSSRIDVSGLAAGSYILIKKDSSGHISSHKIMKM